MVEVGLLANRYATLFADSLSTASFYTEQMDVDSQDANKIIDIDEQHFISDYTDNNVNMVTHPLMCRFCDQHVCDANTYVEMAKVAAVSCMHNCIPKPYAEVTSKSGKDVDWIFRKRRSTTPFLP